MGLIISYAVAGALVTAVVLPLLFWALKRRTLYTALTIDDLIDYFQQVEPQRILEIADRAQGFHRFTGDVSRIPVSYREGSAKLQQLLEKLNRQSYDYRRHLRLDLDLLRDYTQRMVHNTARVGHVAKSAVSTMAEHNLVYTPEQLSGIQEAIDAVEAFKQIAAPILRKSWWWSLSRFHERAWGPIPDFRGFQILLLLQAYDRVKQAAETYALFFGDVGKLIAEEIRVKM